MKTTVPQRLPHRCHRLTAHRRGEPRTDAPPTIDNAPWPKSVAKEFELYVLIVFGSPAVLAIHYPGLLRVHLQTTVSQPGGEMLTHPHGLCLAPAMENAIIGITTKRDVRVVPDQPMIQCIVQEQIRENWRQRAALRRSDSSRGRLPILTYYWHSQPAFHMEQNPAFVAVMTQCFE
jgi:hypothetical protein